MPAIVTQRTSSIFTEMTPWAARQQPGEHTESHQVAQQKATIKVLEKTQPVIHSEQAAMRLLSYDKAKGTHQL